MLKRQAFHQVFELYHPAVAAVYFLGILLLCMSTFHPAFLLLFLAFGLAYEITEIGLRKTAKGLVWQIPLIAIIALVNPLFSASGSTELFHIGTYAIYAESLLYGACMGILLVCVICWFRLASSVLTAEKIMMLTGNKLPTLGLLICMTMRLVPQFVNQGNAIKQTQNACTAAKTKSRYAEKLRQITVLMGWTMEDSLEASATMRARGWGQSKKRSTYLIRSFKVRDGIAVAILVILFALSAWGAWLSCASFSFYPTVSAAFTITYLLPSAFLLALPAFLYAKEHLSWIH
jgi:energy-coupling factor transport system permease protein